MVQVLRGVGGLSPSAAQAFATLHYGGALEAIEIEPAGGTWQAVYDMAATAASYPGSPRIILEYPMLPALVIGASLASGASGGYDVNADAFVSAVVNAGIAPRTIVAIGPEFNRADRAWRAKTNPTAFVTYWNRVAAKLKAAGIRTLWTVSLGQTDIDPATVYPAPGNVDYIGAVLFDYKFSDATVTAAQRWTNTVSQTYGLDWLATWAKGKLKPIIFPRWGLDLKGDTLTGVNGGGDDDVLFVQNSYDWMKANYVAAFLAYQVDIGGLAPAVLGFPIIPGAAGTPDPTIWRSSHGSTAPSTAIAIDAVQGRLFLNSGPAGGNNVTDRALLKLLSIQKYEWDIRAKVLFGSTADIIEIYPGASDFDPAFGTTMGTGLQVQLSTFAWRLGYRATTGFVTLASGSWALGTSSEVGVRVLTGPLLSGSQAFTLQQGTAAAFDTDPKSLAVIGTVTLTAAQRTAAGPAGFAMLQQLGYQSTGAGVVSQVTGFSQFQPIPGAT